MRARISQEKPPPTIIISLKPKGMKGKLKEKRTQNIIMFPYAVATTNRATKCVQRSQWKRERPKAMINELMRTSEQIVVDNKVRCIFNNIHFYN